MHFAEADTLPKRIDTFALCIVTIPFLFPTKANLRPRENVTTLVNRLSLITYHLDVLEGKEP